MSYPINYPTPQGANVQIFYADIGGITGANTGSQTWIKPQGASFVWFTLIGAGGGGNGASIGGGSGAVTNCMVPAFLIPDSLIVGVKTGGAGGVGGAGGDTSIWLQRKTSQEFLLLQAKGANGTAAAAATTSNYFSAMGFYQSIAGQAGESGAQPASTTTFLSGGSQSGSSVTANYGFSTATTGNFFMNPIIVGVGALGSNQGGIGCGGGDTGAGGNGLAVIITW